MKHNFVDSKYYLNLKYFKNKFIDSKYNYRFEIVFCRFQNVTADLGNESRFEIYFFFGLQYICRFEKYLLGMTLLGHCRTVLQ